MAMLDSVYSVVQIAPTGVETFVRLSQNENGRTLIFAIVGGTIPSGSTVTISGTKPDGVVFSASGSLSGNTATFTESIQLTAVAGIWPAKLKVVNSGRTIATGRIRFVIDADTVAAGAVPSDSELEGLVAEAAAYAEAAKDGAYYGSPLKAATVAEMTDKNRVYVYTGSESGYTNGNWYYWDGSTWASGGVYNSVAVDTDKTLNVSGKAADAKVTGDAIRANAAGVAKNTDDINELKADLEQIVPGLSDEAKVALLACFANVAWINEDGQTYYDNLESALYSDSYPMIKATFNPGAHKIYNVFSADDVKQYITVKFYETKESEGITISQNNFTVTGTLTSGDSVLRVAYQEYSTTLAISGVIDFYNVHHWNSGSDTDVSIVLDRGTYNTIDPTTQIQTTTVEASYSATRRSMWMKYGENKAYYSDLTLSDYYAIPIPEDATGVSITITPSTYRFNCMFRHINETDPHLLTLVTESGWTTGSYSRNDIPYVEGRGTSQMICLNTQGVSGSFSAGDPVFDITFTTE